MRFRNLPLFWKLLVPFVALIVIVGAFGAFLIVRDLTSRARATLNQNLLQSSLEARALVQHRELYLLDSGNLAANLQGMAVAVSRHDAGEATRLLRTVVALKQDLNLVAVASPASVLVEFARRGGATELRAVAPSDWRAAPLVRAVSDGSGAGKKAGFVTAGGERFLAIVSPICSATESCESVGVAIVGIRLDRLLGEIADATSDGGGAAELALYDRDGALLYASDDGAPARAKAKPQGRNLVRRAHTAGQVEHQTLYAPFEVNGDPVGVIAVSLPSNTVFASVRSAALRLTFLLLVALIGIVGLGALLSRQILRQVRPLVEVNRALGTGDLSARVPVISGDEIGEVARGLNQMAEQLQASHETLESRVAQRTEEVQRLLAQRTEFFASLSHELRTPLAVILNESDVLLDDRRSPHTISAQAIKLSGAQLLRVVNDILDLAKAEVGGLEVEPTKVALSEAVEELRPTIEGLARAGSQTTTIRIPKSLPPVSADPQRLREIVLNLLDNAVKYSPAGGKITLSASADRDMVRIDVSDTGRGIPDEIGERVFEPFFRVKDSKPQPGRSSSGLGLALTKRLIEAHGGEIWFISRPGKGTTFSFTLRPAEARAPTGDPSRALMVRRDRAGNVVTIVHGSLPGFGHQGASNGSREV